MSLIGSLNAAKTSLAAHSAALQTTSNNVANAATPGYTRQRADLQNRQGTNGGAAATLGNGVRLAGVERQIDRALEMRLRGGISEEAAAASRVDLLGQLEHVFNELSDEDLSTRTSEFFNAWARLADKPQDLALRDVVVQEGRSLAGLLNEMDAELGLAADRADETLRGDVEAANRLAGTVADFNKQIAAAENGGRTPVNDLRDRRDQAVRDLAQLVNLRTADGTAGGTDVYVGSSLVVSGGQSFGLNLRPPRPTDFQTAPEKQSARPVVAVGDDQGRLDVRSGRVGGTLAARAVAEEARGDLDDLAGRLIFDLNKLHAQGQGLTGRAEFTASAAVDDPALPLDAAGNGLAFGPKNGSFVVHVTDAATGLTDQTLVDVDLDGLGAGTTLDDLAASLDAIDGVGAAVTAGRLRVTSTNPGGAIAFADDSSDVLAALGVNGFFEGSGASDVRVAEALAANPRHLAAAGNGRPGDNTTALAIGALESAPGPDGLSLEQTYTRLVSDVTGASADARTAREAAGGVRSTLEAQRDALSGVSLDEEAADLLRYQRAYQAAARLIAATDEMLMTVINLV